jgi:hypothetical protein
MTVWHEFPIHSLSTALITPSQKDSLDNQKFTRCLAIVQGFLAPLAPPSPYGTSKINLLLPATFCVIRSSRNDTMTHYEHRRVSNQNLVAFSQKKSPDPTIKIGFLRDFLGKPDFR